MRFLIVADIHGNFEALSAVLEEGERLRADRVLVLGDLVGYGAGPREVIETVRGLALPSDVIRGNHDKVVAEIESGANFNSVALAAARWTTLSLSDDEMSYLRELPSGPVKVAGGAVICHGSPLDEDEYMLSSEQAAQALAGSPAKLTFFGHTHIPTLFVENADGLAVSVPQGERCSVDLEPGARYMVNPGSVGQPRDRDSRASCALYDDQRGRIRWHRIEYAIEKAQKRIIDAELPQILAYRLAVGI